MEMSRFVPHAPGDAGAVAGAASSGGGPRWTGSGEGNLHGSLTLHGTTRKLVVPSVLETRPDGSLRITGKVGLDMTDFGVKPPSMLFFRVRPGVTVSFDLGWKPAAPGAGGLSGTASARTARVPDADDQE